MNGKEIRSGENIDYYLNTTDSMTFSSVLIPLDVIRPSEYDGVSLEDEKKFRLFGCELIQEGGIMLKLPQNAMVTAMELFHRFYFRQSFIKYDLRPIAAACLFLATKLEEAPKKVRDVVSVFDYLLKIKEGTVPPIPVLDLNSNDFLMLRQELINAERLILREIGFALGHLSVKPFRYLYYYLKVLKLNKVFAQKAWNYINDIFRTSICVSFPSYVLAAAAIYLASRVLDYPLPEVEWWLAFDCKMEELKEIASEALKLYQMKKVTLKEMQTIMTKHLLASAATQAEEEKKIIIPIIPSKDAGISATALTKVKEDTSPEQKRMEDAKEPSSSMIAPVLPSAAISALREGKTAVDNKEQHHSRSGQRRRRSKTRSRSRDRRRGSRRINSNRSKSRSRSRSSSNNKRRARRTGRDKERKKQEAKVEREVTSIKEKNEQEEEKKHEQEPMQDTDIHYYDRLEKEKTKVDFYAEYLKLSKHRNEAEEHK